MGCLIFQYLRSLVSPATISLPRCLAVDSCGMTVRRHHILIDSNHHSVIDKAKLQDTLGIWLPAPLSYFMQMNILFSNAWLSRYVTKHCSLLSQYAMTFAGVSCATVHSPSDSRSGVRIFGHGPDSKRRLRRIMCNKGMRGLALHHTFLIVCFELSVKLLIP